MLGSRNRFIVVCHKDLSVVDSRSALSYNELTVSHMGQGPVRLFHLEKQDESACQGVALEGVDWIYT